MLNRVLVPISNRSKLVAAAAAASSSCASAVVVTNDSSSGSSCCCHTNTNTSPVSSAPSRCYYPVVSEQRGALLHPTTILLKQFKRRHLRPQREPQAGDWICSCGHTNSKFRRDCHKCNGPAPPLPLGESRPKLPGEDPHDWACPCGKMNYRGNVNCHKCGMPRAPTPEQEAKNGMWKCSKCACLNRVNRKFCFQCRSLQSVSGVGVGNDGKAVGGGGVGGSAADGGGAAAYQQYQQYQQPVYTPPPQQ